MVLLVLWKPFVLVLGFLIALMLVSYFRSALIQEKIPHLPALEIAGCVCTSCRQPFNWRTSTLPLRPS